jgi:hypothetical protein
MGSVACETRFLGENGSQLEGAAMLAAHDGAAVPEAHPDLLPEMADLAIKVIEPHAASHAAGRSSKGGAGGNVKAAPAQEAYDYVGSILQHPQLTRTEQQSLLWVLAQCPAYHTLIPSSAFGDHEMPEWKHCATSSSRCVEAGCCAACVGGRVHGMLAASVQLGAAS